MTDSFNARGTLKVGDKDYGIYGLEAVGAERLARLPYSLKILLENLLRHEDGVNVTKSDVDALLNWDAKAEPSQEISFTPARVILQDFTGVPAVVDLAAMRDAVVKLGGKAETHQPAVACRTGDRSLGAGGSLWNCRLTGREQRHRVRP